FFVVILLVHYTEVSFFFQAEDGIRDFHVTGVQTCALPIFVNESAALKRSPGRGRSVASAWRTSTWVPANRRASGSARTGSSSTRSEERRVGKEWGRAGARADGQ